MLVIHICSSDWPRKFFSSSYGNSAKLSAQKSIIDIASWFFARGGWPSSEVISMLSLFSLFLILEDTITSLLSVSPRFQIIQPQGNVKCGIWGTFTWLGFFCSKRPKTECCCVEDEKAIGNCWSGDPYLTETKKWRYKALHSCYSCSQGVYSIPPCFLDSALLLSLSLSLHWEMYHLSLLSVLLFKLSSFRFSWLPLLLFAASCFYVSTCFAISFDSCEISSMSMWEIGLLR